MNQGPSEPCYATGVPENGGRWGNEQRSADCGSVLLRTQIRRVFGTTEYVTADLSGG